MLTRTRTRTRTPTRRDRAARGRLRFGLQAKLVLFGLVMAVAPLVAVWTAGVIEAQMRRQIEAEIDRCLDELGAELSRPGAAADEARPPGSAVGDPRWLERFARRRHVMVRILDRDGAVSLETSPRHAERWVAVRSIWHGVDDVFFGPAGPPDLLAHESTLPPPPRRPEVRAALAGRRASRWGYDADARMFVYSAADPIPGGEGGAFYVTRISRRVIRSLYDVRYQLLKLTLFMIATAALFGLFVGRRLVSPLIRMERRIGDYLRNPRGEALAELALARGDELGDLSRSFEELTRRLRRQVEETSSVASDLAHDLKNPIATVAATAELLEGEAPITADRQARVARALSGAAGHMRRSVDGLLSLARLDATLASAPRGPVDLGRLARRVADEAEAARKPEGVSIDVRVEASDAVVAGIEDQLATAVGNLLDNALAFCRSDVRLAVARRGDDVVLTVADDGPGVSPGNREKVFRRFFTSRPEGSSASAGTGLGLAIARAVARAHGGDVELLDAAESSLGGACFRVALPAASPPPR